jgi:peptide/nickel transport system permease protein
MGRTRTLSRRQRILRAFLRNKTAMTGIALLLLFAIAALFAPWVAPYSPTDMSISDILSSPSLSHPFGTDDFGRDVFSRVVYGARVSLRVGFSVSILSGVLGTLVGLIAAYYRRLDNVLMRIMDTMLSFPAVLLAIALMAVLGPSELNAILALSVVYLPRTARVCRSQVLAVKEEDYVEAARAAGAGDARILRRHILPNVLAALIVQQTLIFALAILVEAALSFLGVGTPPPAPSWGNILNESRDFLRVAPWTSIASGSVIVLVVLAINLVGDSLRDILDPKL